MDGSNLVRLYRDEQTGQVEEQNLMQVKAPSYSMTRTFATDAYLMDDVVAVRIGDGG